MKNNLVQIITVILALLMFVSCSNKTNDSTVTTENVDVNSPNTNDPPINKIIAPDFLVESSREELTSENTSKLFDKATDHGLRTNLIEVVSEDLKGTKKTLDISETTELIYQTTSHQLLSNSSPQHGTFYSTFDRYVSADKLIKAEYLRDTDTLSYYGNLHQYQSNVKLSRQELIEKAQNFILKFVPKETLDKYQLDYTNFDEINGSLSLRYRLKIGDYYTDSSIQILLWSDGTVTLFQNTNYQKYDSLAQSISNEKVEEAIKALVERYTSIEDYEVTPTVDPYITTDVSGNVYVCAPTYCQFDDYECVKLFYAKIAE